MIRKGTICFVMVNLIVYVTSAALPSAITPCHRSDPQIDNCILAESKKMYKLVYNGYPQLGIPGMNPLELHDFTINNGATGISVNATDGLVLGIQPTDLKDFKINFEKKTINIRLVHSINLDCKYATAGRILAIPIVGKGNLRVTATDLDWNMSLKWELTKGKDNKEHMKIKKSKIKYEVALAQFKFDGLLNHEIDVAMNQLLNENWKEIVAELGDPSLQVLQRKYTDIINRFFNKVSYDELFPQ